MITDKKRQSHFLIYAFYAPFCVLVAFIQLLLGTQLHIFMMGCLLLIIAGSPLFFFGVTDITALFAFGLLSKYSILPFFIKTMIGERIDVGLLDVDKTFTVMLVGSFIVVIALATSKTIRIRKMLLDISFSDVQLKLFGFLAYGLGFVLMMLHVFVRPTFIRGEMTQGFGGFGSFLGLLFLGVVATTAHLAKTDSKKVVNIPLVLMLGGSLIISLADNLKLYFTLSILSYLITLFIFRRKLSIRHVAVGFLLALLYLSIVVPIIHSLRTPSFAEANYQQRAEMFKQFLYKNVTGMGGSSPDGRAIANYDYYPNLHSPLVDRLEMVQDLDVVLNGINRKNTVGWQPVHLSIESALPSILVPNKRNEADIDFIAYQIGLTSKVEIWRQTIGIFGVSYAMFMSPGWMILTFFLLSSYFLMIRKLVAPSVIGNLFGAYLLVRFGMGFSEADVTGVIVTMVRTIPVDLVAIFILLRITRIMQKKRVS